MRLRKTFVRYFVPHKRNKYKPLFLRVEAVSVTASVVVGLFLVATITDKVLIAGSAPQMAAVVASTLIDLANSDRTQKDLPTLAVNPELQAAAQAKADDMAAKGYFAHNAPDGHDPWYWFTQAGYSFSYAGENLAVYFSDSNDVNAAWMNSPEHRANILNANFTEIGIATARGMYQGQETTFVVQEFGTPAALAATPSVQQTQPEVAAVSPATPETIAAANPQAPQVKAAAIRQPNVKVIQEDVNFIAVKNENASAPASSQATAGTTPVVSVNPMQLFFLKFITSPQSDLTFAYEIIGAIVALALMLEVGIELKRQHPHRIVLGLSLIALMVVLLYGGHAFFVGQVIIA